MRRATGGAGIRGAPVALAILALAVLLAPSAASATPVTGAKAPRAESPRAATSLPTPIRRVVLVVLENAERSTVLADGPYEKYLAAHYGDATHDYAVCHPSAPNYLALTSGSTQGRCGNDNYTEINARNLGDALRSSGRSWASFEESMPTKCDTTDHFPYAVRHNPFVFYGDVVDNASRCDARDLSFASSPGWDSDVKNGAIPAFSLVVPNLKDDGHDTNVSYADAWLKGWLTPLVNSTTWSSSTAFFITYDEGKTKKGANGCYGGNVYLAVVSPYSRGLSVTTNTSHYGVLTTIEWLLGLPSLGNLDNVTRFPPLKGLFAFPALAAGSGESGTGGFAIPLTGKLASLERALRSD
jgi:hypothetical protein